MTQTGTRMTAEELLRLPDRGVRYELIAGELHEMPPAGGEHGFVGGKASQAKVEEWLRAGSRLVWVLYPATQTAVAYQADGAARLLHADDTLTGEPVLPGFACRVGELFG